MMDMVNTLEAGAAAPSQTNSAWRGDIFASMIGLLGEAKADEILMRFQAELARRFTEPENREAIRRDAHSIASTSGLLGFMTLSDLAVALELRCTSEEAFADQLDVLLKGAALVNVAIDRRLSRSPATGAGMG